MLREFLRPLVAFLIAALVFGVLERLASLDRRGAPWRRSGFWCDFAWWVWTPFVTRTVTRVGAGIALFFVTWVSLGHPLDKAALLEHVRRETWASALPLPLEILLTLLVADLVGYWLHRAFHRGWLWRSHAVHHSSERLDWLAAVRVHPINDLLGGVVRVVLLVVLGFRPVVLAGVLPVLTAYALLLHANVPWTFGRVGRVVASPMFHRWHHARVVPEWARPDGVNFGGFFVVWDRLFGTFHLPVGVPALETGITEPMPTGLLGQLAYPLRRPRTSQNATFDAR